MKKCFKCGIEKPLEEFYKHKQMADGRLGKCKDCTKKDSSTREHILRGDPNWVLQERERTREKFHRLGYGDKYNKRGEQKKIIMQRYFENHPEKRHSSNLVSNAIRDGRLIKQPCEICQTEQGVQAHHEDYSKPLEVRWLCIKHHNERHVELREKELLNTHAI